MPAATGLRFPETSHLSRGTTSSRTHLNALPRWGESLAAVLVVVRLGLHIDVKRSEDSQSDTSRREAVGRSKLGHIDVKRSDNPQSDTSTIGHSLSVTRMAHAGGRVQRPRSHGGNGSGLVLSGQDSSLGRASHFHRFDFVLGDLDVQSLRHGPELKVHRWTFWPAQTGCSAASARGSQLLRCSPVCAPQAAPTDPYCSPCSSTS